ncbi:MAG: tRNA (5-methylaminomethyl-2-thiouridine)(34)-methyltransferase MnmD [Eudoraea sp.]|nr:tRNA (5-methylaminomethyl-2-thiouridine)(34)-methyltransferase MnmD [Eudoraea sp.]
MKREIITTSDGSTTIHVVDWDEHYHSRHGALQEAYHVFIDHGLSGIKKNQITVLEMGFGTGLNAFITFLEAGKRQLSIEYIGIEAYPVSPEELEQLNYVETLDVKDQQHHFDRMHSCPWEKQCTLSQNFQLIKLQKDFREVFQKEFCDLVYFDAFGARVQPELWTEAIFESMFQALRSEGVLVTYAAKGSVRRAMMAVGFKVERLPGPPGKREMLRATKP